MQWTALENERVILQRAKQLAEDRVTACEVILDSARQTGNMNLIMAASTALQAAQMLERQAIMNLYANSVEEYNLAAQANQNGCTLTSN